MLDGIKIKPIKRNVDERGYFCEAMRNDWKELFGEDKVAQVNHSFTYPTVIRAWHRHLRGQVDYFLLLRAPSKSALMTTKQASLTRGFERFRFTGCTYTGHYWYGFKAVGNEPAMLVYFTTNP